MKCRFFLLDINEDRSAAKPTVRLWGLNDRGERVLILATQILPYFYYMPDEKDDPDSVRERLLKPGTKFTKILRIEIEKKKKLLGLPCNVLRITCSDSEVLTAYARDILKDLGKGTTYEEDLRLSVRYVTDTELTLCGWQEFEVEPIQDDRFAVDSVFAAEALPAKSPEDTPPAMRILAFSLLTVGERGSAKPEIDPIRAIAVATGKGKVEILLNEGKDDSQLLTDFVAFTREFDPDIIVGFESNSLVWPYIIQRCKLRKIKLALGRDGSEPHTSMFGHVSVAGRADVDLFDITVGIAEIKVNNIENLARYLQTPSSGKAETIEESDRFILWKDESGRRKLAENAKANAQIMLELAEAAINFPMQLSALTGLPLDQVMTAAVGFRVDSYLIKQAHMLAELIPPRVEQPFFTYRGAIVLEPKTGLHDNVVALDFSSMYPSLMEKYNLSPDTLVRPAEKVSEDSVFIIPEVSHRFRKQPNGFYRTVLKELIEQRNRIKGEVTKLEEKSTRYRVLRERERAVKIITNACYGYAGWAGARWYAREVAESAAALGRDTITKTIAKADSLGLKVIYGDTDSIFVTDDHKKVEQLVKWAKQEVDLEIKREREYVRILFTEAMKRYAGLVPDGSLDIVGLEVVRGDWSDIAREVQEQVLTRILCEQSTEKAIEDVRTTIRKLKNGEVPIINLTIRKTLTKQIEDYKVRTPHVEVAKLLVKQGWDLGVGDKVAYVIVKGSGKLFQKARPASQVNPKDIDIEYYLDNQIKPAAMRILERFGVNETQLAV